MKKILIAILCLFIPVVSISAKEIIIKKDIQNGTITADKSEAAEGETITLKAVPDKGYELKDIKVLDKFDEMPVEVKNNSFVMPSYIVYISAEFTKIEGNEDNNNDNIGNPNNENNQNNEEQPNDQEETLKDNTTIYIIGGVAILLVVGAVIFISVKKKK